MKVDAQTDEQWKKDFVNQVIDSEKGWRKNYVILHIFRDFPRPQTMEHVLLIKIKLRVFFSAANKYMLAIYLLRT